MHSVVKAFRANIVEGRFTSLIVSVFVIVMRIMLFANKGLPELSFQNSNYLWQHLSFFFSKPEISFTASTFSVFIIAWINNTINNRFSLFRTRSNLPFIYPLFFLSLHPYFLIMTSDYIAIIFILLSFFPLLKSYQKPDSYLYSFRSSILIATASLFQFFAIILIPLMWRGERTMRGPQIRSLLSSLFGVLLVYISVFSIYFILDDITGFLLPFNSLLNISLPEIPSYTIFELVMALFILMFFVLNMVFSINTYGRDKVLTLNFMRFIVFLLIFLLLLQMVYWGKTLFFLVLSITLISYLSAYFYTRNNSRNHIYLVYFMFLIMIMIYLSHYSALFDIIS
ncbi:MAG: hypothetical protein ITF98_04625 [Fermentimonas sp.]|nr:hypothetical protein [Fermentimonas sp.]